MSQIKDKYQIYINSSGWNETRIAIRKEYEKNGWSIVCAKCGTTSGLNLHHNYYCNNLNNTNLSDVDYLCFACHKHWHYLQKRMSWNQNSWVLQNFNFYICDKNPWERDETLHLLSKKIDKDATVVTSFFLKPQVIEYEKEEKRTARLALPFLVISFFLIFFYGIGIFTWWLTAKLTKNKYAKPTDYDSFIEKRGSLEEKKECLKTLRGY